MMYGVHHVKVALYTHMAAFLPYVYQLRLMSHIKLNFVLVFAATAGPCV